MDINNAIRLTSEDSGISLAIVRLNNSHIDSKKQDKTKFYRRNALLITNLDNGQNTVRYVMGAGGLPINKQSIAIDYDTADSLGIKFKSPCHLDVKRASRFQVYRWLLRHPDLSVSISIGLGLLGAVLGALGLFISLISLI